ncbi:predicted protein [Nematostella vectensis]|uniref:Caffeoyl-CoA O-methyltransferase n=1 Tax=Nematostella vectensis TaxID=45351 RepID=A7S758_NEMVE|nr:predicted protein [Nematostella vectensis]|eukprot:XP_001632538.1 predicted protein [Nematostella vectensis]
MVGHLESQFLKMMAQIANAKRVLDVGTFTGMSAMAFAEGIPPDGQVVTIEFDQTIASTADKLFRDSAQAHKLALKVGDAVDVMTDLKSAQEKFDIIFLDAAKDQYITYYHLALSMLTPTGFILADNSLCALLYDPDDSRRQALHDFNQLVKNDKRVEQLALPFREGVSIIRPKN